MTLATLERYSYWLSSDLRNFSGIEILNNHFVTPDGALVTVKGVDPIAGQRRSLGFRLYSRI